MIASRGWKGVCGLGKKLVGTLSRRGCSDDLMNLLETVCTTYEYMPLAQAEGRMLFAHR